MKQKQHTFIEIAENHEENSYEEAAAKDIIANNVVSSSVPRTEHLHTGD